MDNLSLVIADAAHAVIGAAGYPRGNSELATSEELRLAAPDDVVTVTELAEFLRLHPSMQLHSADIYRRLRRGKLGGFRVGSRWAFRREALDRLVQRTPNPRRAC
jgi:hypothetical protein